MSYVNTENEAYQKLNNWQKWLVHFSQNALTRFIYQLILLADLVGLAIAVINSFNNKLISIINYNPIVLPIGLVYLLAMQFGWLLSWYAMVNHEKRRQIYFKWIYSWLILTTLLIAISIVLYFSAISFNNKLVYTSLCFFIGWFGYEMVTAFLHLQDQIKISPIVNTDEKTFFRDMRNRQISSETIDKIKKCHYQGFYEYAREEKITINNNINSLSNIIKLWLYKYNRLIVLLLVVIACIFMISCILSFSNIPTKNFVIAILFCLLAYYIGFHQATNVSVLIWNDYGCEYNLIECSKDNIINKHENEYYRLDTCSLQTDWSDVKYRNRNQHDTATEKISHQLHLAFNGKIAHRIYATSLSIILLIYLITAYLMIADSISNFINMISNQITKLINLINFQAVGYGLGALIVIAIIVTLCYLEYAYLCKQK